MIPFVDIAFTTKLHRKIVVMVTPNRFQLAGVLVVSFFLFEGKLALLHKAYWYFVQSSKVLGSSWT